MDYALEFASQAQKWHETDHGKDRGKPLRRSKFLEPQPDGFDPEQVPESFRDCSLCKPTTDKPFQARERENPFWFRVVAWETES